ncbi:hypothetical protein CC78DRAFT_559337 [Lojkania enalia]|uniref:FAD-binding domain-containing protein n=1 Tax=Lojkania enalia TaxID=147567 RepID=A0A9P4KHI1_9PLEO|nr:hypothetical protein CC78DRAFT_559337 [Didymosphaeria enalia]
MAQQPVSNIGVGIGGLVLGRSLLQHDILSILYERIPSTPRHSYGITLHPSAFRPLLDVLSMDEWTFKRRVAVDGVLGGSGEMNPNLMIHPRSLEFASFRTHREKLERPLREGLDDAPRGMVIHLQSVQQLENKCIIGVDGPHSNTRKSLSTDTPLAVLPFFAKSDVIMNVSVNDQQADLVPVSWTYSRPSRGPIDPLHKPNWPVSGATDIPEAFFQEISELGDINQPYKEVFDPEKVRMERVLRWLMRTMLVSLQELQEAWKEGRLFYRGCCAAEPILCGERATVEGMELAECIATSGLGGILSWYMSRKDTIVEMHGDRRAAL